MNDSTTISWIIPNLRRPSCGQTLWNSASNVTVKAVCLFSKLLICWLNETQTYNIKNLGKILETRPYIPLVTVSNHYSCFDDPGIWGSLNWKQLLGATRKRWSLAAHDICFTSKLRSYFFMLGKCIPVIRGKGIYQECIEFCLELLCKGEWIHIFPEGRVNLTKEIIRLKWGVGRLIYDSPVTPIVVPIWHIGMDQVVPNQPPYVPKLGKRITINFGKPIHFTNLLKELRSRKVEGKAAFKAITDRIQTELMNLKLETETLHRFNWSK